MKKVKESPFSFKNINILSLDFECKNILEDGKHEIQINREVETINLSENLEEMIFEKRVILNLVIFNEDKKAFVSSSIQGDFKSKGIAEDKAKILFEQNAPSLLLSYLRPILSVVLQKSYFPVDIPFLNFTR